MDKKIEIKKGTIEELIFHNNENGYTIAVFDTEDEEFTVVGSVVNPARGMRLAVTGSFRIHPRYGEQFVFTEYEELAPSGIHAIENFLASGTVKGIGRKTASAIVEKFGEDTLKIMEEAPERLTQIPGIGNKRAAMIAESYSLHREFANVSMALQKYGIRTEHAIKLYRYYGSRTVSIVEENPYVLINDIYGIGFRTADEIAMKMGFAEDDPFRVKSGIRYALWFSLNEGHTYYPQTQLCEMTGRLLDISMSTVYDCLLEMAFEGDVTIENDEGINNVYLTPYYIAEQSVAGKLFALNTATVKPLASDIESLIKQAESGSGIMLSDMQHEAVKSAAKNTVSVITGGPGTGKTTIINTIIRVFTLSGLEVDIAAPTGRAAKRITETSGFNAVTIHRLLEYTHEDDNDSMFFGRNSENPLKSDAVIVDEASMIDLMLMNALLDALRPGTRLIIVGDADQLPSVGAGNVLRDIIESEYICSVKLTEIFRQASESLIITNAHRINRGEYPKYNEKGKEFFFMRKKTEPEMLDLITELVKTRLPAYYSDADPLKDIQVLTPVRKGNLGTVSMNQKLQAVLNPPSDEVQEKKYGDRIFREGDKVMQIKNNYQTAWKKKDSMEEGEGIFNGDVGYIESIDKEYGYMTVVFDDDKYVRYNFENLDELELAYAVTVHKSQGSEFPVVIMPVSWFPPVLATRNLLYTAVTRGKEAVVLVGSEGRLQAMIDNNRITARYSGLRKKLSDLIGIGEGMV